LKLLRLFLYSTIVDSDGLTSTKSFNTSNRNYFCPTFEAVPTVSTCCSIVAIIAVSYLTDPIKIFCPIQKSATLAIFILLEPIEDPISRVLHFVQENPGVIIVSLPSGSALYFY